MVVMVFSLFSLSPYFLFTHLDSLLITVITHLLVWILLLITVITHLLVWILLIGDPIPISLFGSNPFV